MNSFPLQGITNALEIYIATASVYCNCCQFRVRWGTIPYRHFIRDKIDDIVFKKELIVLFCVLKILLMFSTRNFYKYVILKINCKQKKKKYIYYSIL